MPNVQYIWGNLEIFAVLPAQAYSGTFRII